MIPSPPTAPCRAPLLLAQMKSAIGGSAWRRIGEVKAVATARMSGLSGTAIFASDVRTGRYAQRFTISVMGSSAQVYDGRTVWSQDISGGVHPLDATFARERAVTNAYLTRQEYLSSSSRARVTCLANEVDDGRVVERLFVQPVHGIPAVLAVDPKTHLLDSVTERLPSSVAVTRFSDYRELDDVVLPFTIASGSVSEPDDDYVANVRRYVFRKRADATDFSRPRQLHPAIMLGGATSTTVPLRIDGRQLLVWASINGHRSMPFILDTGGHAILTTGAAKLLGIRGSGAGTSGGSGAGTVALQYAPVFSVRIGRAELRDQRFLIINYPYEFYERGQRQPLAGILGLEIFERFAARIDYGRERLTLTPLAHYTHASGGVALPITFQEDMPMGYAVADGHRGLFGIDTGNAGVVILFGTFLRNTGLLHVYSKGIAVQGHGTGGSNAATLVTLRRFEIAGRTFRRVPAALTRMQSGSFSSWTEAGNVGYEILARFVPTFDYAQGLLYLDESPFAHEPRRVRAGFIAEKVVPNSFIVAQVVPGSVAADVGMVPGDSIVAVDGKPATQLSFGDLYALVTGKPGTNIRLTIVHDGKRRVVQLILR